MKSRSPHESTGARNTAPGLTSLANTQGQLYGKLNETSQFSFEAWDYLEYPGTRRGPGGTNELYEYTGSMQDWNDALEHNEVTAADLAGRPDALQAPFEEKEKGRWAVFQTNLQRFFWHFNSKLEI